MDDSLKVLDLTTDGNVSLPADTPVVPTPPTPAPTPPTPPTAPLGASAPEPVVVASTNGPKEKKPMGKKTKIVAGVLSAILLFAGLGVGLFLAKSRQNVTPRAYSPGNCRCSGTSWICENEQGGFDYQGEEPSCQTGTPPETVSQTVVTNPNTGVQTTTSQTVVFTNPTTGTTTTSTYTGATGTSTNTTGGTGSVNTGGTTVTTSGGSTTGGTGGPTLSTGAGGVQVVRTGACAQCGGQGQGGCDNMPTSYGTEASQQCGFGCVGGLYFCPASGSCQASCPGNIISAGPLSSNKEIETCLTKGTGCNNGNAKGITQAMLIAASGGTNSTGTDNKIVYDGGGLTAAQCNADGDNWCMGIPEAPASQPLLKNGFCGKAGFAAGKTCNDQFKANFGFNVTYGCKDESGTYKASGCGYSSGSLGGITWTWDHFKGFTLSNQNALIVRRYYCDNLFSLSSTTGCTCATETAHCKIFTGADALAFNQNLCGVQQIDLDTGTGAHVSRNIVNENCGSTPTIITNTPNGGTPSNPPSGGSNPTPTPTTTTQSYACYQLSIMKNGNNISAANVQVGDALVMRGFATATNTTVSKMRFVVSINGVAQAPVDVNASLISGMYQADLPYTITQAASYSVTTTPISP